MNELTHQNLLGAAMLALDACCHRIDSQNDEIARLRAEVETLWSRHLPRSPTSCAGACGR
ncbi:MAG: hypothetical protein AB7R89_28255 [Dehalococcoidia bacterium]